MRAGTTSPHSRRITRSQVAVGLGILLGLAASSSSLSGQLVRSLRIGELDGPPEYTFGLVGGIVPLPDGRILVLDMQARTLRIFSETGEHELSFGRRGAGPGEFEAPAPPVISDDQILVYDSRWRRLVRYSLEGEHLETSPFATDVASFGRLVPVRADQWIGLVNAPPPSDFSALAAGTADPETLGRRRLLFLSGTHVDTIARIRDGSSWWVATNGRDFGLIPGSGSHETIWTVSGDSLLVTVDAVRGLVTWLRVRDGLLEQAAERDLGLEPIAFDPREAERAASIAAARHEHVTGIEVPTPRFAPRFSQVLAAPNGDVWLRRRRDDSAAPVAYLVVAFDSATTREITMPAGFHPGLIGTDRIWGVSVDQFDVQYVEAYSYR